MNKIFKNSTIQPVTNTVNEAGHAAYKLSDKAALANYCMCGTFNQSFYVSAEVQLEKVIELANKVPTKFIGQLAIYARSEGLMKDSPALLCAILAVKDVELLKIIFPQVIDNGRMLRNFVQVIRSNKLGRHSFGTAIKKLIQRWFNSRTDEQLLNDSVGNDPSLADVIKLTHPAAKTPEREALFGYIIGRKVVTKKSDMEKNEHGRYTTVLRSTLPDCVQKYEIYKEASLNGDTKGLDIPKCEFRLLSALNLKKYEWSEIAKTAPFQMTRMNLNTFARHGVFENSELVDIVSKRLSDSEQVRRSRVFPYQLLAAYLNTEDVPSKIKNALQDALEASIQNIPTFKCDGIHVLIDTSGSMGGASITGNRASATSKVRCVDVAGLIGASILRKNQNSNVILFDTTIHKVDLNARDSVLTNAKKCARNGGGTDCACGVRELNSKNAKGDLIIIVSDNEANSQFGRHNLRGEWNIYKKRNPKAKLVLIDIAIGETTQASDDKSVINISGFSDSVFKIIENFVDSKGDHFVEEIEKISIQPILPVVQSVRKHVKENKTYKKQSRTKNGRFA